MLTLSLALCPLVQDLAFSERHQILPAELQFGGLLPGDVDGDGHLDVLEGTQRLFRNRGDRTFELGPELPPPSTQVNEAALADLDGDADLDLVRGLGDFYSFSPLAVNEVLLNDGTGLYQSLPGALAGPARYTASIDLADFNGDGFLDLACGNSQAYYSSADYQNTLWFGLGNGTFVDLSALLPATDRLTRTVRFFDAQGDGHVDLFSTHLNHHAELFHGDGQGGLVDASAQVAAIPQTYRARIGDLDGDLDLDVMIKGAWYENSGGSFALAAGTVGVSPFDFELADLTGDALLDLMAPDGLYANDGAGNFVLAPTEVDDWAFGVSVGDFDGDGDTDVMTNRGYAEFAINFEPAAERLYFNDGAGGLVEATELDPSVPRQATSARDVATGDLDGDGDSDAYFAWRRDSGFGSLEIKGLLLENDGTGRMVDVSQRLPLTQNILEACDMFDVEGDGDTDIVIASTTNIDGGGGGVQWLKNDGAGDFVQGGLNPVSGALNVVELAHGDLDGDGDQDVIGAADPKFVGYSTSVLCLNDGAGQFDSSNDVFVGAGYRHFDVALGDLDLDGDLDAAFASVEGSVLFLPYSDGLNQIWFNDGSAGFQHDIAALPQQPISTHRIALADFDADGDLDLWADHEGPDELYRNNGSGSFSWTTTDVPELPGHGRALAAIDADLDGDADVLALGGGVDRYYENDGSGVFTDQSARMPADDSTAHGLSVDDFDRDGDPDVLVATADSLFSGLGVSVYANHDRLLTNRVRQLAWRNVPALGKTCDVELCGEGGGPIFPWIALSNVQLDLGLGVLQLDPFSAVPLAPLSLPANGGCTSLALPLPATPSLVGGEVWMQFAAALPTVWLSNVERFPLTSL